MACVEPRLPQDLERVIFLITAESVDCRAQDVLQLMLVAWRVHAWVKPCLYKSLHLGFETDPDGNLCLPDLWEPRATSLERLKASTSTWISPNTPCKWTKEIVIYVPPPLQVGEQLLSSFPNVDHVALFTWGSEPGFNKEFAFLASRPLKSLYFFLSSTFVRLAEELESRPSSTPAMLASHIFFERLVTDELPRLLKFSSLTHLALPYSTAMIESSLGNTRALLARDQLVLLVMLLHSPKHITGPQKALQSAGIVDPRIVLADLPTFEDRRRWLSFWEDLDGFWTKCEAVALTQHKQKPHGCANLVDI